MYEIFDLCFKPFTATGVRKCFRKEIKIQRFREELKISWISHVYYIYWVLYLFTVYTVPVCSWLLLLVPLESKFFAGLIRTHICWYVENKREPIAYLPVQPFFFLQIILNRTYSQCVQKRTTLWPLKRVTGCAWVTKKWLSSICSHDQLLQLPSLNLPGIRDSHRVSMALSRILFRSVFLVVICLLLVTHFRFLWWIEVKNPGILSLFEWENICFSRRRFLYGLFKH